MRNLKKILALVLALVMVIGLMGVASAAAPGTEYKDDAAITNYDEAIQILTALGIYEGDENAAFNPNNTITRAEVAALVYRIVTQDVEGKHVALYADYNKFADVDSNAWYAGYVNFCANGGYLMGDGTNFFPMEKVTGYQVLAIMLRVIGYGQEGEYEGTNWHIRTASKAADLGITDTVIPGTLGAYSTRGMVAELLYRAIAQTSTVSYNRLTVYTKDNCTYAYTHFGLRGCAGVNPLLGISYTNMTVNAPAEADGIYGEPISFWYFDGGVIDIRYNTVATFKDTVNQATLYAISKVAYNYAIDGVDTTNVAMDNSGKTFAEGTARGVTTEVFVADGRMFVVVKNNFVGINVYDWNAKYQTSVIYADNHPHGLTNDYIYDGKVMGHVETDAYGVTAHIAKNTVVLYNVYQDGREFVLDIHSIRAAEKTLAQPIAWTYVPAANAKVSSTFTVGDTTYIYSNGYNVTMNDPILDRDELVKVGQTVQDLYFDDYGNVIYTVATKAQVPAAETGYVVIRYGSYGIRIADNRWVVDFSAINSNGEMTTIRGAINGAYYTTQREADETAAAAIGMYFYTKVGDYYALTPVVDNNAERMEDKAPVSVIHPGDADALAAGGEAHLLDSDTLFVITEYDLGGAISGYKIVKGFKNIPVLTGNINVEYVYNKYSEVEFIYVAGAAQSAQAVGTATVDNSFYLVDTTPNKQFNTFDRHAVIVNGVATTMDFVKGFVSTNGLTNGFYNVTGLTNGLVSKVSGPATLVADLDIVAKDVLKTSTGYYTLANNCVVYNINTAKGTVAVIPASEYFSNECATGYIAAQDAYGYVTVLYMLNAK